MNIPRTENLRSCSFSFASILQKYKNPCSHVKCSQDHMRLCDHNRSCWRADQIGNHFTLLPSLLISSFPLSWDVHMILPGFTDSSLVSTSFKPTALWSSIGFSLVYQLQLPLFNHFGHYICDISLSVPTCDSFYKACNISLECSHIPGDTEIDLGSDWISSCFTTFFDDWTGLENLITSIVTSLPASNYWSPNDGVVDCPPAVLLTNVLSLIDTLTPWKFMLSKLNSCCNNPKLDISAFSLPTIWTLMMCH